MNTLVSVAVFGLVPVPPMPDTSSTSYRSGEHRDWVSVKTVAWRANRERLRLSERR